MSAVGETGAYPKDHRLGDKSSEPADARRRNPLGISIEQEEPLARGQDLRHVTDESIVPEKPEIGGHADSVAQLHSFLEHRSRQWSTALRVMELQRQYVQSIEAERDAAYHKLAQVIERLDESAQATKASLGKTGVNPVDLATTFERNRKVLEDLENVSVALSTNFLCWRSAWEQYAHTAQTARKLGSEMKEAPIPRV